MDKMRDSFFLSDKRNKNKDKGQLHEDEVKKKRPDNYNHNGVDKQEAKPDKKPFDKKTYRLKKYSKKYKLEKWEEQRKKKLLHNYYKDIKNDETSGSYKPKSFDEDTTDSNQEIGRFVRHPDLVDKIKKQALQVKSKKDPFWKAKEQYNKLKQDKLKKQQDREKANEERQQKLQEYKKKKQERFKKLSKKTKKGQPVMTGRLEMLLEKIQSG